MFDERFDAALIGICYVSDLGPIALYSKQKIYAVLDGQGLDCDEKKEYYQWHFSGFRGGEFTPVVWADLTE